MYFWSSIIVYDFSSNLKSIFYWMRNDESISKKFKSFSKQKILRCTFKHNQSIKIKGIKRRENKEDEKLKAQLNVDPSNCPRIYHPCAMKCKRFFPDLEPIIGPRAEFHDTCLLIKRKIFNIYFTGRLVNGRRFPLYQPVPP